LQEAGAFALHLDDSYYDELRSKYTERRDTLMAILTDAGFRCHKPLGAYYIMTDIHDFGFANDMAFAEHLVKNIGVATVPGSSFYRESTDGNQQIRFCFCKRDETLQAAGQRLQKLGKK
jgi:aminotransferase